MRCALLTYGLLVVDNFTEADGKETLRIISARKADKTALTPPQQQAELAALQAEPDNEIDYSEIPATTPEQWRDVQQGLFYRPLKQQLSFRIDADVLAWFKDQGKGYQTRINELLRQAMVRELGR
jgi:uncharacterized protein (DUF4415 family)